MLFLVKLCCHWVQLGHGMDVDVGWEDEATLALDLLEPSHFGGNSPNQATRLYA